MENDMKKVVELELAAACKGSPVQIMECAGVHLGDGDKLLVLESVADRMVKQYRGKLAKGKSSEVEKLKNGHYEVVVSKGGSPAPKAAPKKKEEPVAKAEQPAAEEGQTSDRSMGSSDGKPKSKAKKKKSRSRKED